MGNLCPHASEGCKALCLGQYSGQAAIVRNLERGLNPTRRSRRDKARRFMRDRAAYMVDVVRAVENARRQAARAGLELCVRMNGSTDIAWERIACVRHGQRYPSVMAAFPAIQFVDYTKNPGRMTRQLPANYHLTFSRSETNEDVARQLLWDGYNVAVVFAGSLPVFYLGFVVIDGDAHDLRHLDPRAACGQPGYVVALSPKGSKARKDTSGFVVRLT